MIGYTPAEMDLRSAHGDPYATGRDDDQAPDDQARPELAVAA